LPEQYKKPIEEKNGLHPRNKHNSRYNFEALVKSCPEFGDLSVDFSNPEAVKMLNRALLQHFYELKHWDIPANYLCPPIPGRADYIHYIADLLAICNLGVIPTGNAVKVLDVGVGANCVYPLIGNHEYGWSFIGTDIDADAIAVAQQNINDNSLGEVIELRHQNNPSNIYNEAIKAGEYFDLAICNPPFHTSLQEAEQVSSRKTNNLGTEAGANFGGKNNELWYPGGEAAFISKMIYQSSKAPLQCFWYSTLVSKKDNLYNIYKALNKVGVLDIKTINMAQGQKQSRVVAWTFLDDHRQMEWREQRWK